MHERGERDAQVLREVHEEADPVLVRLLDPVLERLLNPGVEPAVELVLALQQQQRVQLLLVERRLRVQVLQDRGDGADREGVEEDADEHHHDCDHPGNEGGKSTSRPWSPRGCRRTRR